MRVLLYPADKTGCGYLRLIAPGEILQRQGHNVGIVRTQDRRVRVHIQGDTVTRVDIEPGVDVVVFQRLTNPYMAQAVPLLRAQGIAVVVDVDDDLTCIDPGNAAWAGLHPRSRTHHSWAHVTRACRDATLVTVSTPPLLDVYARHGRGRVLPNCLPERYFGHTRVDNDEIVWPASLHSHPNDPHVVGGAMARLVGEGARFRMIGQSAGAGAAFGLAQDPPGGGVALQEWPAALAGIGVGIAPLADTKFNLAKSHLKPLELCAMGVPWVASPREEYAKLHAQGAGILAERPRTWYRELRALRQSEALRTELSEAGRAVVERWRMTDHAWRWWETWEEALRIQRSTQPRQVRPGAAFGRVRVSS